MTKKQLPHCRTAIGSRCMGSLSLHVLRTRLPHARTHSTPRCTKTSVHRMQLRKRFHQHLLAFFLCVLSEKERKHKQAVCWVGKFPANKEGKPLTPVVFIFLCCQTTRALTMFRLISFIGHTSELPLNAGNPTCSPAVCADTPVAKHVHAMHSL